MTLKERVEKQLSEGSADEFRFKLKKILNLNKSQMQRIVDFINRGDYTNAMIQYQNLLKVSEEAAQNFIIGIASSQKLNSDKSKFGKKV